jgi:nitric oxide reductase NorD protein
VHPERRLNADQMEERLEPFLDPVLSSRRTAAGPARKLAGFERAQQEFVLRWVEIIARSNAEVAYQFADAISQAFQAMDEAAIEAWVIHAMDIYDKRGLHPAVSAISDVAGYVQQLHQRASGVSFEQVAPILQLFVRGLAGRELKFEPAPEVYTDTETLFLPPLLYRLPESRDNFQLYKAITVHLWAQTWYGTFRPEIVADLLAFRDPVKAAQWFYAAETLRLDGCIARELPGIHREMRRLRGQLGEAEVMPLLRRYLEELQSPEASARDSLRIAKALYDAELPGPLCYQGQVFLDRVEAAVSLRREREKQLFRTALAQFVDENRERAHPEPLDLVPEVSVHPRSYDPEGAGEIAGLSFELRLDGQPIAPPDDVQALMASIIQDLGEIPPDYLVPAGNGPYSLGQESQELRPEDVWKGTYHEEGAILYNEWDFKRGHYRKNWCVLRELDVHPQQDDFATHTLAKYSGLIKHLRRTFEVLRGEDKLLKRQTYGDDIDIDALVQAYADTRSGMELTDRLFVKRHKLERDIAVMFMVDMSGSTKGWINDAEREALVLLCEALETLGDRYAIYGFSGMTRKRCELYRIKRFEEPYSDLVQARISGIRPQDYTRMGVAIRHLARLLSEVEAKTRLLITLSDGKPDDYDGYRGEYGIEDTRQALLEAKRQGIHPFCITIDKEGLDYLPHMYGMVNYTVLDEVRKLPLKVSDIYRRLTT